MKAKKTLSVILAVFLAASIIALIKKEFSGGKGGAPGESAPAPLAGNKGATAQPAGSKTIVFYFHGNMRCATCMKFESYTKDLFSSNLKDDVSSGKIELKVVNVDEPQNSHFVKEYDLNTRALVVSSWKDGKQADWTNLHQIWDRVGDEADFKKYVEDEIREMMLEK